MSDVVNTSVAPLCHSQDHPGSVPVPAVSESALLAQEDSFREPESLLGSRETTRTRHRRIRGLYQHHPPAGPYSPFDQFPLRGADRRIRSLTGHVGPCKKFRAEVLDCDQVMTVDDPLGPNPRIVPSLPGGLLLQLGGIPAGALVPLRLRTTHAAVAPRHRPLGPAELCGTTLAMSEIRQIESRVRGRGCDGHTPVDSDATVHINSRDGGGVAAHHERGVPVTERISMHANACRLGRQFPRPDDRYNDTLGQTQSTVTKRESSGGVLQRWERVTALPERRSPAALHRERVLQRLRVCPQRLLLRDLRALTQPSIAAAGLGEELPELSERRPAAGLLLLHCLVPQVPAPMPLGFESTHRLRAGPEPIAVPHGFFHSTTVIRSTDMYLRRTLRTCPSGLPALKDWVSARESR